MSYGTLQIEKMTTESGYSLGAGNASSFKNRIINGAQRIDQRNAGATVTTNGAFVTDRFRFDGDPSGKMSTGQSSQTPAGFTKSLSAIITAAYTPTGGDYFGFVYQIEGNDIADLDWGTAAAKTVTLSFWARCSVTGTYSFSLNNDANAMSYVTPFTINAANTWEQKTITIAGPTSGTWLTTNGRGIAIRWGLASVSGATSSTNSWLSGGYYSITGQTQLTQTAGATFYMTGVQFEVGTVATSFDFRSYGTELALCQRYFQYSTAACGRWINSTDVFMALPCTPDMRAAPTATVSGSSYIENYAGVNGNVSSIVGFTGTAATRGGTLRIGVTSVTGSPAGGYSCQLYTNGAATSGIAYSAEL